MNELFLKLCDSLYQRHDSIQALLINNKFSEQQNFIESQSSHLGFTDWIGLIAGIAGLAVTIWFGWIAVRFNKEQKQQNEELSSTTNTIGDETSKLQAEIQKLADINRPFYDTFPEIIDGLNRIFKDALRNPTQSELCVMNRTSAFGKIHIYNPKFYNQYNNSLSTNPNQDRVLKDVYTRETNILNDFTINEDKFKYLFQEDLELLYKLVEECSNKLGDEKFKIIIYDAETKSDLEELFIQKYYDEVNTEDDIKNDTSLEYYTFFPAPHKGKASIVTEKTKKDLSNKEEIENKITTDVKKAHNRVIQAIRASKKSCSDDSYWLKYSSEIPMQMYLLHTVIDGKDKYSTFIINAMSSKKSENSDRDINGIFSTEQSIYSVFKTLFDETFKK